MVRYDYVLLDADNTLWDFDQAEFDALEETLRAYGYPRTKENHRRYQRVNRRLWEAFEQGELKQEEVLALRFQEFLKEMGEVGNPYAMNTFYMRQLAEKSRLFPRAEEFCQRLASFCTLALVTNGVSVVQRSRLERSPLSSLFSYVFVSTEMGSQKPSREFFEIVFQGMSIEDPSRVVLMGDSLSSDILGGNNAGVDTIWYNPKKLPGGDIKPRWEVSDFTEAEALILKMQ